MNTDTNHTGIYVTLEELTVLHYRSGGFTLLPRQPKNSLLSGRHASRMRGRGLNFEELRGYLPGDDIRNIDWKVTARLQKPYVRVYTEERDRPAILVVDQRLSMFFGSKVAMKSVTVAQATAVIAWRVFDSGDRIGGVIFNDSDLVELRPHRSRKNILRFLGELVKQNQALNVNEQINENPGQLNKALESVHRLVGHDKIVIILSDFNGLDAYTTRLITLIARHNDVIALPIFDPLATTIPTDAKLVVSDGELQLELDTTRGVLRKQVKEVADKRLKAIMKWQDELAIPVLPISTEDDPADKIRLLLGAGLSK